MRYVQHLNYSLEGAKHTRAAFSDTDDGERAALRTNHAGEVGNDRVDEAKCFDSSGGGW